MILQIPPHTQKKAYIQIDLKTLTNNLTQIPHQTHPKPTHRKFCAVNVRGAEIAVLGVHLQVFLVNIKNCHRNLYYRLSNIWRQYQFLGQF